MLRKLQNTDVHWFHFSYIQNYRLELIVINILWSTFVKLNFILFGCTWNLVIYLKIYLLYNFTKISSKSLQNSHTQARCIILNSITRWFTSFSSIVYMSSFLNICFLRALTSLNISPSSFWLELFAWNFDLLRYASLLYHAVIRISNIQQAILYLQLQPFTETDYSHYMNLNSQTKSEYWTLQDKNQTCSNSSWYKNNCWCNQTSSILGIQVHYQSCLLWNGFDMC